MRVLVVEDEPLARETLKEFLAGEQDVEVVGEAADGLAAVEAIESTAPDLVFLDVRLPELSGLGVLERLERPPAVVFTTAFDRYAVAAFELEAVDYLVKPFGRERFRLTLDRARRRLASSGAVRLPSGLRDALIERPLRRLFARKRDRVVPIAVGEIERIEGAGDYSELHCAETSYLVSLRLQDLAARLDPEMFVRVHRSHLVNLDRVAEIRSRDPHRLEVVLASGAVVPASRSGTQLLRRRFGGRR
ncbi:MAG: LytTR family DNA-binding domain-containing protein [Thermoanaerobaculia bacterium]